MKSKWQVGGGGGGGGGGRGGERIERYFIFFLLISFADLRKSDCRLSSEQKAKLVYATRATHRYQYLSLLSNLKCRKFSYLCYFKLKGYVMA